MAFEPSNKEHAELLARLYVIEKQIGENDKFKDTINKNISDIIVKLDNIKDDIRYHRDIPSIQEKISELEEQINKIKLELPEMLFMKKIFITILTLLIVSFFGLVWNNITYHDNYTDSKKLNEITKKIISDYNKSNDSK